jgi:hypothetical protein
MAAVEGAGEVLVTTSTSKPSLGAVLVVLVVEKYLLLPTLINQRIFCLHLDKL